MALDALDDIDYFKESIKSLESTLRALRENYSDSYRQEYPGYH